MCYKSYPWFYDSFHSATESQGCINVETNRCFERTWIYSIYYKQTKQQKPTRSVFVLVKYCFDFRAISAIMCNSQYEYNALRLPSRIQTRDEFILPERVVQNIQTASLKVTSSHIRSPRVTPPLFRMPQHKIKAQRQKGGNNSCKLPQWIWNTLISCFSL